MKHMRYVLAVLAALAGCLVAVSPVSAAPGFKAPFPCGQSWTYSHHGSEVRLALDFIDNGGNTNGAPALASAARTAFQHSQPSGAGNWISIDHGGGWVTYYFHLQSFSVANGAAVAQGHEIGTVGSSGNSSGPHLHYEQLYTATARPSTSTASRWRRTPAATGRRASPATTPAAGPASRSRRGGTASTCAATPT